MLTNKILLTGGSGLLGSHLKIEADRPSHYELDITDFYDIAEFRENSNYDLIIHCAAYTAVQQAENNREECFRVNVTGTFNLLNAYPDTPIVYISSEYAHNPKNFYSLTKKMAEDLCLYRGNCLIIRTLFKKYPWPFEKAFTDQYTEGGYITDVAPRIEEEIKKWDGKGKRLVYVGDDKGRKTMYDLAKLTKPDVIPNSIKEMKVPIPSDYK